MRRILVLTIAAAMVAMTSSVASADGEPALAYTTKDNNASAWFIEGDRQVSIVVDEAVRLDPAYTGLWVRAAVVSYGEPFIFCNGIVDRSDVNAYYFRNNGAYVDATIPFYCADGSGPFDVHVVGRWNTEGPADMSTTITNVVDDDGIRSVHVLKYSIPSLAGAFVDMDFAPFPVPAFSFGELSLRNLHVVYPQPDQLP